MAGLRLWSSVALVAFIPAVAAHEHDNSKIATGEAMSQDAIDTTLWVHILIQLVAFGIIFPTGMVLGITRNRWHVPVQVVGTILSILGYFLGHAHKGRQFASNIHQSFANSLMLMLFIQVVFGIYLKLHLSRGIHGKIRGVVVKAHGVVGKVMPIVSWIQMLFGGITALGFCRGDHLGQCLAHFIMGSAFIGYGIVMTLLMLVGQAWLRRTGRSQEFFDSLIIAAWGCVNTFTEHRWGGPWVANDIQHTTMGVVWWAAGLVGVWLSRKGDGTPKRNFVPGFVIFLTGWAMSGHPQHLPLSTMVHTFFGYTLMGAGITRIIEIAFILKDKPSVSSRNPKEISSFQHIPPFLLYASGFLFMSATEEQMQLISDANISHVSYILIIYSFAFLMFLLVNMLLHLFEQTMAAPVAPKDVEEPAPRARAAEARTLRDAEEFELEGLMSDDEAPESPSTLGRNNETRVA